MLCQYKDRYCEIGWDGEMAPAKASCSFPPGTFSKNLKKLVAEKGDGKGEPSTDTRTS